MIRLGDDDSRELNDLTPKSTAAFAGPRVLVVEDQLATLRVLAEWLEAAGYSIEVARDGTEAWQKIQANCPEILVTDWNMPRMSGMELCRAVRAEHPRHQMYVLVTTGKEDTTAVMQAMGAGADDFLSKPVDKHELLARVRQAEWALERNRFQAELAETDPLTRLLNRRTFCQQCEREIARSRRAQEPLSCLALDVDYFKLVNDTYGHATGDESLCIIADALRAAAAPGSSIGRLGGDEFNVLLPGTTEAEAAEVATQIREAIAARPLPVGEEMLELKVTIGAAGWREDTATPTDLINLADQALLAAKQSGRDRIMRFGDLCHELSASALHQYNNVLAKVVAADVMTSPIVSLQDSQPLKDAASLFFSLRINSAPVLNGDSELVGIVEEADLLNAAVSSSNWTTQIGDIMKKNVISYDEQAPVVEIWEFLRRVTVHHVVIVAEGRPVGVLSRSTLLRWLNNWSRVALDGTAEPSPCDWRGQLRMTAAAITEGVRELESDLDEPNADLVPSILSTATRLQESAQDLLVLCQPNHRFEPGV